jgi:hypothetical protein
MFIPDKAPMARAWQVSACVGVTDDVAAARLRSARRSMNSI